MNVYRKEYRLHNADTDFYRRLRWDTMFTMFQEASIAHTEALGAGRENTLEAYRMAVENKMKLFSYGDGMLIL